LTRPTKASYSRRMSQPTPTTPERLPIEEVKPIEAEVADWSTPPTVGEVITSMATGNTYTMGGKIGEGNFVLVYSCADVWNSELGGLPTFDDSRSPFPRRVPLDKSEGGVKDKTILSVFLAPLFCQRG
jgi:hypothetical protein